MHTYLPSYTLGQKEAQVCHHHKELASCSMGYDVLCQWDIGVDNREDWRRLWMTKSGDALRAA